jgi:hypothetical protein
MIGVDAVKDEELIKLIKLEHGNMRMNLLSVITARFYATALVIALIMIVRKI